MHNGRTDGLRRGAQCEDVRLGAEACHEAGQRVRQDRQPPGRCCILFVVVVVIVIGGGLASGCRLDQPSGTASLPSASQGAVLTIDRATRKHGGVQIPHCTLAFQHAFECK